MSNSSLSPQPDKKSPPVIDQDVIARMRQAKRVPTPSSDDAPSTPTESGAAATNAKERPAMATPPPRATRQADMPPATPIGRRTQAVITPPAGIVSRLGQDHLRAAPLPKTTHQDWTSDTYLMGPNDDEESLIAAGVVKRQPTYVPELDGIVSQKGAESDGKPPTLLCGQNVDMFGARAHQWPNVPPSSYHDSWVWDALRPKDNEISVELYVSARPLHGEEKVRRSKRRDGTEVESLYLPRNKPAFSYDHHVLMNVEKKESAPWGDARRVLLIPLTHIERQFKASQYATPHTEYVDDINGARAMLAQDEDIGLHVIHGKCALSFVDDDGSEHLSEYWVILPITELERIHKRHFATEADWILYAQHIKDKPETYLRPNERHLGVWLGEGAKTAYKAAKAEMGAIMPDDWTADEVKRLNLLHRGKIQREKEREKIRESERAIISPLSVAAERAKALGEKMNRELSPEPPLANSVSPSFSSPKP